MKSGIDYIGIGCGTLIVNDNDETLLVLRTKNTHAYAGEWSQPGGGVEFGEKVQDAVIREIQEEIGVTVEIVRFLQYTDTFANEDGVYKHWVSMCFLSKIVSGEPTNLEPTKHADLRWFKIDDLPKNVTEYTLNSVKSYKDWKKNA